MLNRTYESATTMSSGKLDSTNFLLVFQTGITLFFQNTKIYNYIMTLTWSDHRRGYSVSKRLVKMTSFKSFPFYQDISLLSFVLVASSTLLRCGWVFIDARQVENWISVEGLNTLNTTYSQFCKTSKNLDPAK